LGIVQDLKIIDGIDDKVAKWSVHLRTTLKRLQKSFSGGGEIIIQREHAR
jgi:hypothetical protein